MADTKKILVVEDNEISREHFASVLRDTGYAVDTAENGQEALACLKASIPHLILLDMLMPVLDGWRFLQILKSSGLNIPVIVVTGTILTQEWASQHDCIGFLQKPVSPTALLAEARRCLP